MWRLEWEHTFVESIRLTPIHFGLKFTTSENLRKASSKLPLKVHLCQCSLYKHLCLTLLDTRSKLLCDSKTPWQPPFWFSISSVWSYTNELPFGRVTAVQKQIKVGLFCQHVTICMTSAFLVHSYVFFGKLFTEFLQAGVCSLREWFHIHTLFI